MAGEEELRKAAYGQNGPCTFPAPRLPMKIFQIGFNKCGTRTIHQYFCDNGIRSVHWDEGRLATRMFKNLSNGEALLTGYEDFDVFTDMEFLSSSGVFLEGYKLFPYLADQYPDAVFILNTRNPEDWIRSRLSHGARAPYARRQMIHHNVQSLDELAAAWRAEWDRHCQRVVKFFDGKPHRFRICRIETDLPQALNAMLPECRLETRHYRRWNARPTPRVRRLLRYQVTENYARVKPLIDFLLRGAFSLFRRNAD